MADKTRTILRIDASMRRDGSATRDLADRYLVGQPASRVTRRDLAANMSDPATRDALLAARLALSDTLVAELRAADTIVIGLPIYNFGCRRRSRRGSTWSPGRG